MKGHTLQKGKSQDTEEHWISISDMMAGLMVIFLFISISYMLYVSAEKERIERILGWIDEIVETHRKSQLDLYDDLEKKFKKDLDEWNAVLNRQTLSIRFREPEVLFELGKATVRPRFKKILDKFFPDYIEILTKTKTENGEYKYKNDIKEIRIEGHTSSEWHRHVGIDKAYIHNMKLSQDRTRNVLKYVLDIEKPQIQQNKEWIKARLTANGLSSSKLIFNSNGTQNRQESRRVEFRVRTNVEKKISEIEKRGKQE